MAEPPSGADAPRCGLCAFFHSERWDEARQGNVGECTRGVWPPIRSPNSGCKDFVARGQLTRAHATNTMADRGHRKKQRRGDGPGVSTDVHADEPAIARAPIEIEVDMDEATFRAVLREVITDELGLADSPIGDRWRGGELVLKPGKEGTQEKKVPLETFFKKLVMVRERLRVLEQKINGSERLSEEEKITLQQYITGAYGSLTTFNVLFRDEGDRFVGAKGDRE